jgi:hypothetical protein
MKRMAASGAKRSFVATADKNIAKPYRFAIKAGIGSKRPTAGVVDQPPVGTISGVSLRGRREQPVASDFARLILPREPLLYLETTTKLLNLLGALFQRLPCGKLRAKFQNETCDNDRLSVAGMVAICLVSAACNRT